MSSGVAGPGSERPGSAPLGDELVAFLAAEPRHGDARVAAWRFELAEADVVRLGVREGRLGGPYEAPTVAARLGGALELRWSDGQVTRATCGRVGLADLSGQLPAWRAEAFPARLAAPMAGSAPCPDVQTFDDRVEAVVRDDPAGLFDLVVDTARWLGVAGVARADVTVAATAGRRRVATSRGFDVAWDETMLRLDLSAEDLHEATYAMRRWTRDGEVGRLTDEVSETARRLRETGSSLAPSRGVLFAPPVVDALLDHFVAKNLDGRAVLGGHARFVAEDFADGRLVMAPTLGLVVDTTLPWAPATAPCSAEGVPGGRAELIRAGRLASPLLDRERAARMGRPPTPQPRGRPRLVLESADPLAEVAAALAEIRDGAVVRSVVGLHTQNARSGAYALVAPEAQVVRSGRAGGRAALRVRGNLFEQLAAPETRLVRFRGYGTPGLLLVGAIDAQPA